MKGNRRVSFLAHAEDLLIFIGKAHLVEKQRNQLLSVVLLVVSVIPSSKLKTHTLTFKMPQDLLS